jgi:H+/Cl- antiporter ClcA
MPSDPLALLRSRDYLRLLMVAAVLGVPVSAAAYGFLALVSYLQKEIFTHLPHGLGFSAEPLWWPLPVLAVGGVHPYAEQWTLLALPLAGLVVGGLAVGYAEGTGKSSSDVRFSGQSALPHLIQHASSYTVGALLLLMVCKGLAYGVSLSGFRGGPVFPAMFIGAAGGDRHVAPAGAAGGRWRRHGHWCDVRGDAHAAAHIGPAGNPAAGL